MFEALVITLREGVEAALVLAIAVAILDRRGLEHLKPALFAGAAVAVAASVAVAALATRITYNEELAEGIAMLVGAALVITLVWWMWRAAPHFKQEIEAGIDRAAAAGQTGASRAMLGLFLFAFGMVFREGVETAVFLSAAGFNSQGLGMWLGAIVGLVLALVFGALFVRGTLRFPLKPFFSVTSAVLILIAVQLVIGGLHELSEAEVLPSSKAEMALIGPVVKNELLLFTLTVALAAGWLLFGPRLQPAAATPLPAAAPASGPQARLERAARSREMNRRRWTGIVALLVVGFLTTAFVATSRVPDRAPAQEVAIERGQLGFDAAACRDGHLHFFETTLPQGPVRFFAVQVGAELRTCFDACEICGDKGYFEDRGAVVCRNCTSPIALSSLGRSGGCNPIPLPHRLEGNRVVITESDFERRLPLLKGR
jgi:FTR1 family protein